MKLVPISATSSSIFGFKIDFLAFALENRGWKVLGSLRVFSNFSILNSVHFDTNLMGASLVFFE